MMIQCKCNLIDDSNTKKYKENKATFSAKFLNTIQSYLILLLAIIFLTWSFNSKTVLKETLYMTMVN